MTDTQTLTLVDFLLARVAEAETAARRQIADGDQSGQPDRVLEKCDIARQLVAELQRTALRPEWGGPAVVDFGQEMLRSLAETYAAHPDYREEWRP